MKAVANGIAIDYLDEGSGLPVVLVHAFPLSTRMWDEQIEALRDHFRVIAVDLRGFGESGAAGEPYSIDNLAADLHDLLGQLALEKVVLLGLSMGGYVAMAFCRLFPEAVQGLVLANTRATADSAEAKQRRFQSAEKALRDGARAIADELIPIAFARATLEGRPDVVSRFRRIIEGTAPKSIAFAQRAMAHRPDSTESLKQSGVPILLIAGEHDQLTTRAEMSQMHSQLPNSTLKVIETAGHLSNVEEPAEFNHAVRQFLHSLDDH